MMEQVDLPGVDPAGDLAAWSRALLAELDAGWSADPVRLAIVHTYRRYAIPVEHLVDEEPAAPLTTVIVPPQLAEALGVPELATAKSNGLLSSGHDGTPTTTDHETDHETEPAAKQALQDEKEVAAK